MYDKNIINARLTKMLEKIKIKEESNPRYMLKKLLQDIDNLEKFYSDKEYRRLVSSSAAGGSYYFPSYSSEYFELENIYQQDRKLKEKLNLPQNSIIRYEKVKCSNNCKHNTHRYYYAYV